MLKRISSLIIVSVFTYTSVFGLVFAPKQVEATGAPVIDFSNLTQAVWGTIKETVLLPLIATISSRLVDKLADDTINWSNNGFEGKPGFINNWDEFLEGTKHDLVAAAFSAATTVAQGAVYNIQSNRDDYTSCVQSARSTYEFDQEMEGEMKGSSGDVSLEQFITTRCSAKAFSPETEKKVAQCKSGSQTAIRFINSINKSQEYESYSEDICKGILTEEIPLREKTKDYEDCLKESASIFINDRIKESDKYKKYAESSCALSDLGSLGNLAESNWQASKNEGVRASRDTTRTIGRYGLEQFGESKLGRLLRNEGQTITNIYERFGTNADEYNETIKTGGWGAYIALSDPMNTASGRAALILEEVSKENKNKLVNKVNDLQTTNKYLDKVTCEGSRDPDGTCIGREVALTPGLLVQDQLAKALGADQEKATAYTNILVGSLLKGIGKITNSFFEKGVSSLTQVASRSFFEESDLNNFIGSLGTETDYRSEYDVLGIQADSSFAEFNNTMQTGVEEVARIKSIIGGPEDVTGNIRTDPQIIIDLEKELEEAIVYGAQEEKYYQDIQKKVAATKRAAIEMDRCNPGPDYGWKERYRDRLKMSNPDDEKEILNAEALPEIINMSTDPRINIPGSSQMTYLFKQISEGSALNDPELKRRIDDLRDVKATLTKLEIDIMDQLFAAKEKSGVPNLFIFDKEWSDYTLERKTEVFQAVLDKGYGIIPDEYLNLTAREYVVENDIRARDLSKSMSWDLWAKHTDREEKTEVRYPFYIINSNVSTEAFVQTARVREDQFAFFAKQIPELLNDCLILKLFTIGGPQSLPGRVNIGPEDGPKTIFDKFIQLNKTAVGAAPLVATFMFAVGGGLVALATAKWWRANEVNMIPGPGQSSESIRNFLKAEDVRRETKGQSSYFLTPYVSSDAAVKASILGFTGELVENISDGICVHPDIYAISTSAISVTQETEQVEIEQDFDREDAEFNSSNTVSPSTNTTYTATTTGDTCESTYSPEPTYRDCTSNGMTFCSGGKEYVCEGQTTTTGGGSSGSSGRIDLTESGERETSNTNQQLNQNIIYVDALGYIYDVYIEEITLDSAPKIQRRGGTKPIDPGKIETKLVVRFKTDRRVTILRGTLPETPAIMPIVMTH